MSQYAEAQALIARSTTVADCDRGTNANCIRTKIGGVVQSYCAYRTCASSKDGFFTINDSQLNNRYTNCAG